MLVWQFYSYNHGMNVAQAANPEQGHFYFYPPGTKPPEATPAPKTDGADVRQVDYQIKDGQPNPSCFMSHVVLKNVGTAKATNVRIWVRPYRGITIGDEDAGWPPTHPLSDNDPLAQIGEWLAFPDLAPGDSSAEDVIFTVHSNVKPGQESRPADHFSNGEARSPKRGAFSRAATSVLP